MFRKVSRERAKDREKEFLLERKAAGCVERCLDQCGQGGNDTYSMEYINMCEAP